MQLKKEEAKCNFFLAAPTHPAPPYCNMFHFYRFLWHLSPKVKVQHQKENCIVDSHPERECLLHLCELAGTRAGSVQQLHMLLLASAVDKAVNC